MVTIASLSNIMQGEKESLDYTLISSLKSQ